LGEDKVAARRFKFLQTAEEAHAEEIHGQGVARYDERFDVAHDNPANADFGQGRRRRVHNAIGGGDRAREGRSRRNDAEATGSIGAQGHHRRPGVDHRRNGAPVDARVNEVVPAGVCRNRDLAAVSDLDPLRYLRQPRLLSFSGWRRRLRRRVRCDSIGAVEQ